MNLCEIGMRIKARRKELFLSQEKLAESVNVTPHYIYEIERGIKAMSLETLEQMSLSLNLSTDYIIFGDNKAEKNSFSEISENDKKLLEEIEKLLIKYRK